MASIAGLLTGSFLQELLEMDVHPSDTASSSGMLSPVHLAPATIPDVRLLTGPLIQELLHI